MRYFQVFLLFLVTVFFAACIQDETPEPDFRPLDYTIGKNLYQITVDGVERSFHVFVPNSYDETIDVPLVMMFHGSGQSGNKMYETSGWTELGEQEGFIVVFPTALEYYVTTVGRNQTKWSAGGLVNDLEPGTEIVDDIPFLQEMLERLKYSFSIDEDRIYAAGFSNGGGFIKSRLMCEMSDQIAAIGASGGVGLPVFTPIVSEDLISLYTIVGNRDDKKLAQADQTNPFPMDATEIMNHPFLQKDINNILEMLQLDSTYTHEIVAPHFNTLTFANSQSNFQNEFRFRMVKDMGHIWPNGGNHPSGLSAPEVFWEFFLEHEK